MAQVEFAYNNSVNRSTGKPPFEIVTGMQPRGISDWRDVVGEEKRSIGGEEFLDFMESLHKEVNRWLTNVGRTIQTIYGYLYHQL